jgi:hypothetical protein
VRPHFAEHTGILPSGLSLDRANQFVVVAGVWHTCCSFFGTRYGNGFAKHSTLHKRRKSDPKIIADQQGHGMRTHFEEYVQSEVAERKAEAAKLYADFLRVFRNLG